MVNFEAEFSWLTIRVDHFKPGSNRYRGFQHPIWHYFGCPISWTAFGTLETECFYEAGAPQVRRCKFGACIETYRTFCSDGPTKRGHLFIMTDANANSWDRRWFVLKR